jgi:hypothetical protein
VTPIDCRTEAMITKLLLLGDMIACQRRVQKEGDRDCEGRGESRGRKREVESGVSAYQWRLTNNLSNLCLKRIGKLCIEDKTWARGEKGFDEQDVV